MSRQSNEQGSLFELQRNYILNKLKSIQIPGNLYTLVIDDKTEIILYRVIKKEQLLRLVTSIEKIDDNRKQQTFLEAIYFIDPSVYNFKCIVADVNSHRYKKGWGLFLPLLDSDSTTNQFYNSNQFMNNPKVQNYFDFGENITDIQSYMFPYESRVFLVDNKTPNSLPIYFNENCSDLVMAQIRNAAKSLVSMMVVTGEYPLIRYYSPQNTFFYKATRLSELIADEFQRQIDDYARDHEDFPLVDNRGKPRSILFIADRTVDLYAPLLHEFTYQAMAMDIVPSLEREGKYKYEAENEKGELIQSESTVENENDQDWVNLRHLHIIESSELIINKINELIKNNPLMVDRSKAKSSSDLMHIVANLKGFDEERKQITLHKTLIDECLDLNGERKLAEFAADFEQTCCAEGITFEGEKNKHLHEDLIVLLARDDLHINDKMRLVLIYGFYRGGLIEADFIKLAKFIGVKDTQIISLVSKCFQNLHKLGFPIIKNHLNDPSVKKKMFHTINNDGTYNTSRFGPGIKSLLQFLTKYQLDEDWFPYYRDKPLDEDIPAEIAIMKTQQNHNGLTSLRNSRIKASWAQSSSKVNLNSARNRQRIFCYVAGGITYSETRSIYELSNTLQKDIYIGSECILKPRDFLIGLQTIDDKKLLPDLNLELYKQLVSNKEPPSYLYENQTRQYQAKPAPASGSGNYSGQSQYSSPLSTRGSYSNQATSNNSVNQMSIDFKNFNVLPQPANDNVPSHYQKRVSSYNPEAPNINEKPKKTSRLKKLFK